MEAKFGFYEKVVVDCDDPRKAEIHGQHAAVLGRACGDEGHWTYAVSIYSSGVCWVCQESELRSTGDFDCRENFFSGASIRVSQDGELLG
jgi:hypothetical protein